MKLTELQRYQLREALRNSSEVLRQIKIKKLKPAEIEDMKQLETVVQTLECLLIA